MNSSNDNLHSHNYPRSKTSVSRNLDRIHHRLSVLCCYLSYVPPIGRVQHKAFLKWVRALGRDPDMPGFLKNDPTPVNIPRKKGSSSARLRPPGDGKSLRGRPAEPRRGLVLASMSGRLDKQPSHNNRSMQRKIRPGCNSIHKSRSLC